MSTRPHSLWRSHGALLLLLAARLGLGLAYSQVVPAWEAYDEDGHFAYGHFLAQHHVLTLPASDPEAAQIWEKFQPPLYYNLISPVIALFDQGTAFQAPARNPYFTAGDAGVNYALHPVQPPTAAERTLELALRAARVVSVLISTLSVVAVYFTAQRLWPKDQTTIWAATLLYAFWPQFIFIGSMVTNDVLITALAALAVWLSVILALGGFQLRQALALAALVGAGLMTKLNGAALVILAVGALALSLRPGGARLRRTLNARLLLGLGGLVVLVVGALWALSSLKFVTAQVFRVATLRDFATNLGGGGQTAHTFVWTALAYAFRTFLASYGWGNLESFNWLYWLWTLGALLAAAGWVWAAWRRLRGRPNDGPPARVYWLLAAFSLTVCGLALALAISLQNVYLVPGRYLLPALPAIVMLLAGGWRACLPSRLPRRIAWQAMSLGLILVGWIVPFRILAPAYAQPAPSDGRVDTPVGAVYGGSLELLGYDGAIQAVAGDHLTATLCWQAIAPVQSDHTLFLEVVGPDGQGYGRLHTYPGHGNYPTSQWPPNTPFCEPYTVQVGSDIPAPALAHLRVSWLAGTGGKPLPLRLASGQAQDDSAVTLEFKVASRPGFVPGIAHPTDYRLGQQIKLTGYDVVADGQQVRVTLRWQALDDITANDVVFVHLRDTPIHAYAQGDSLPLQGAYPTRLWKKGEVILDPHVLTLPAGRPTPLLDLYAGMVDTSTNKRLVAFDIGGNELPNDEVVLTRGLVFR